MEIKYMTEKVIKKAIVELKTELEKKFDNVKDVYLYGSVARKQHTTESDIDILVITDNNLKDVDEEKIMDTAYETGLKYNVVFGIVVCSLSGWGKLKFLGSPFYEEVTKEAVRI